NCRGVCEPGVGAACTTDLQCPPSDYCDACAGACKARAEQCGRCPDTRACDTRSTCHPVGDEGLTYCLRRCQGSCDVLGPGYSCEDIGGGVTACVPESRSCRQVGECASDNDCPPSRFCNERLQCQPGCADDTGCPNGQVCQGARCGPPCTADADCGDGAECLPDGHCRVPGGCASSADCPEAETYCDREQMRCVPGCQVDDDCLDANKQCVANSCVRRGCGGNFQCGFGEVCDLETAECEMATGRHCEADCDPMDETSCGTEGQRCLSLQDEDENPLGDYCFEPCMPEPNECPQGYSCVELEDQEGNVTDRLCIRRCDLDPFR
ncbi:MAG: hypothetical protein KC583_07575, partial [Myxococcales bacterium]|nr:hypothetical protein [Myxococcales bacterium]